MFGNSEVENKTGRSDAWRTIEDPVHSLYIFARVMQFTHTRAFECLPPVVRLTESS